MKDAAKTILRASLAPESLILGVASCNFMLVRIASAAECMGYICPWYYRAWWFTNEPARLLAAACLLRVGRAWGYSAAVALCGFMLLESIPGYAEQYASGVLLDSLRVWGSLFLSLHTQYLLAIIILVYSAARWGRSAAPRGEPLR